MPEIVVKFDDKIVERVVTEKERLSIGRAPDNDIILDNRGISRKHARIELAGNEAILIDNESLNGTFINRRKVTEERLRDNDVITIGKFELEFHARTTGEEKMSDLDGTMILNTRKQKELLQKDREDRKLVRNCGCSLLLGVENARQDSYTLDRDVTTIGKSKYVNIKVPGLFVSGVQAKIVREGSSYSLISVGRNGKVFVNGEPATRYDLKNGDIVKVGKTVFRFIEAS